MYPPDGAIQSDMWRDSTVSVKVSKEGMDRETEGDGDTSAPRSSQIKLLTALVCLIDVHLIH